VGRVFVGRGFVRRAGAAEVPAKIAMEFPILHFYWDHYNLAETFNSSNTLAKTIIPGQGLDQPVAEILLDVNDMNHNLSTADYCTYYLAGNIINSIANATNSSGDIVESYQYTPFGEVTMLDEDGQEINSSLTLNSFLFAGGQYDEETGLYWKVFRTYDPVTP
jgi:uncharacterized protein RhaS with RHS repeats